MKLHIKDLKAGDVVYDETGQRYVIESSGNLAESASHKDNWYAETEPFVDDGVEVTVMFDDEAELWDNPNQQ